MTLSESLHAALAIGSGQSNSRCRAPRERGQDFKGHKPPHLKILECVRSCVAVKLMIAEISLSSFLSLMRATLVMLVYQRTTRALFIRLI